VAENDVSGGPPAAGAAPAAEPQLGWVVLCLLFGTALGADSWASTYAEMTFGTYLEGQILALGYFLFMLAMAAAIGRGGPLRRLREPLFLVPVYLVKQFAPLTSIAVGWKGGWFPGTMGAATGAAAGAAMGWLFIRWTLPEIDNRSRERVRIVLPIGLALLFALFGAYNWAITPLQPEHAWVIGIVWIALALPGALVGRPRKGLVAASPLAFMLGLPAVASMTVGWEGGWISGSAGAAVGAAAGAVMGLLFNRWIMPEYYKLRARGTSSE
jgi:hypothetical protein